MATAIRTLKTSTATTARGAVTAREADLGARRFARQGRAEPSSRLQSARRDWQGADESHPGITNPKRFAELLRAIDVHGLAGHAHCPARSSGVLRTSWQGADEGALVRVRPGRGLVDDPSHTHEDEARASGTVVHASRCDAARTCQAHRARRGQFRIRGARARRAHSENTLNAALRARLRHASRALRPRLPHERQHDD